MEGRQARLLLAVTCGTPVWVTQDYFLIRPSSGLPVLHCSSGMAASRMPVMNLQRSTFVDRLLTGLFPAPIRAGVPDGVTWIDLMSFDEEDR